MLKRFMALVRKLLRLGPLLMEVACVLGCGARPQPLPTTYPVHGTVTYRDRKPVTGGLVQFQAQAEPSVTTVATIQSDGMYRMSTMRNGLRVDGAVAGPNRVIVTPPGSTTSQQATNTDIGRRGVIPTVYPVPYNVEPRDNEYHLTIERP